MGKDVLHLPYSKEHIIQVGKLIDNSAGMSGYFHWSLLDNFEWDKGFWPRFGLYEVDRKTQERKPRPSAQVYADLIKNKKGV